jgi:hypothetical protein
MGAVSKGFSEEVQSPTSVRMLFCPAHAPVLL